MDFGKIILGYIFVIGASLLCGSQEESHPKSQCFHDGTFLFVPAVVKRQHDHNDVDTDDEFDVLSLPKVVMYPGRQYITPPVPQSPQYSSRTKRS